MRKQTAASLAEVHSTIDTENQTGFWKKLFSFLGPAYLVSVGYMDPGNWATDIAAGSEFGYRLIWVLLMSNVIALLLQSLSARLGVVRGLDLAQASRESYPPFVNFFLYLLAEIAIAACDLAEVLGMAIGLQLLFGLPLIAGVGLTVLDTFLLLFLQSYGMRKMEAFILALVAIIGCAFLCEMIFAKPEVGEVVKGFIPSLPGPNALYLAIGIIGATVMPHNLYLHSSLVQTRKINRTDKGLRSAIRFNIFDSVIALNLAFLVNSAILILAAAAFYKNGMFNVAEIKDAHQFLAPLLGTKWAPILFAVALIAAGQSSTITGTLAGQVVMEGYLNLRIQPWIRRLLTRLIAIAPALFTIIIFGEGATGKLLVLSQVVLSMQLGFAVIPLIHFVSDKQKMHKFAIPWYVKFPAWICAILIVGLNSKLVYESLSEWISTSPNHTLLMFTIVPLVILCFAILLYITIKPLVSKQKGVILKKQLELTDTFAELKQSGAYHRIAMAVDFSKTDISTITHALSQGNKDAHYILIHIVETAGALIMGSDIQDKETDSDIENLKIYADQIQSAGYKVEYKLGYGNPKKVIPLMVTEFNSDILVMGAHGHKVFKDLLLGTTVESVRHALVIPVLIVR